MIELLPELGPRISAFMTSTSKRFQTKIHQVKHQTQQGSRSLSGSIWAAVIIIIIEEEEEEKVEKEQRRRKRKKKKKQKKKKKKKKERK